jgi:hypothetical protein
MSQPLLEIAAEAPPHPIDIVHDILHEVGSLPRLIEIHYLAEEPLLLEIMRSLGALPVEDRVRLREYLARRGQERLGVRELSTGALILEFADKAQLDKSA